MLYRLTMERSGSCDVVVDIFFPILSATGRFAAATGIPGWLFLSTAGIGDIRRRLKTA